MDWKATIVEKYNGEVVASVWSRLNLELIIDGLQFPKVLRVLLQLKFIEEHRLLAFNHLDQGSRSLFNFTLSYSVNGNILIVSMNYHI